ncbi:MAG: hemolysin family protein [Ignavibacteriales bacterium]|nr:hemolysin family protein [Ignavibacteriales bacterium]
MLDVNKMDSTTIEIIILLILFFANGIFAMSEIAIVSSRKARLEDLNKKGHHRSKIALDLANSPGKFLSTVQVGITAVGIIAGTFGGATLAEKLVLYFKSFELTAKYSGFLGYFIVITFITYLSLIIGELVPKRIAINNPEKIAILIAFPMKVISIIAKPIVSFLTFSTNVILKLLGVKPSSEPTVTEEEIKILIREGKTAGIIEEAEQDILNSVFKFGDKRVESIMTPRTQIAWLDLHSPMDENLKIISERNYSHYPVCDENIDNLLGVVRIKDIFKSHIENKDLMLKDSLLQPLFVPETSRALILLERFKETKNHVAIVIDEYGGIQGLVTLTDLVEEVLGEFPGSDQEEEPYAVKREDESWLIDGMIPIDEFKEIFSLEILPGEEEEEFQTISGFIMLQLERIPHTGDKFENSGLSFEVVDMDGNRIDKILVKKMPLPNVNQID